MSLKSEAEAIRDLADHIVTFEILRLRFVANGGTIQAIEGDPDSAVTLTNPQKQALLAVEAGWQTQIKTIANSWT